MTTLFNLRTALGVLLVSSTMAFAGPREPKAPSFRANAFVTIQNKIWIGVEKSSEPVVIILRNQQNEVLYQHVVGKKQKQFTTRLNVGNLTDGLYVLEFKSPEGSIQKEVQLSTPEPRPARMISMN